MDTAAKALFSGDVFASLDVGSMLLAEDFEELVARMALFHVEYMASNIAARGFVHRLAGLEIQAILPQHGCIIPRPLVAGALHWLKELRCGTDILSIRSFRLEGGRRKRAARLKGGERQA